MSFTVITTQLNHTTPTLTLRLAEQEAKETLPISLKDMLQSLLDKMRQSLLASPTTSALEKIAAFELQFSPYYSIDFTSEVSEEVRENASLDLCFFLYNVIHPTLASYLENSDAQNTWLAFDEEIRNILTLTIPSGEDVDLFIDQYENFADEEIQIQKQMQVIDFLYQKQMQQLYDSANAFNTHLIQQFDARRQLLLEVSQKLLTEAKEIHTCLDPLTEKVNQQSTKMKFLSEKIQAITEKMSQQEELSRQILEEGRQFALQVLKKV